MSLEVVEIGGGGKSVDDFPVSDLLADYKQEATIIETPVEAPVHQESKPVEESVQTGPDGRVPESVWRANPDKYYQRGAKKGLPRDKAFTKTTATYNTTATTSIPATMLINGALFLAVVNFIIPMAIITANNWMYPKEKMTLKDIKFSDSEKKEIDPLMDATLKQLNINGNPLVLLLITLASGYSMKFINRKVEFGVEEIELKDDKK